jgi:TonB family protein
MKLNDREQAKPNFAGLVYPVQHAEMKLILADLWPALKPLPVFKYVTDEYRAEIHFDRAHGEWVCRKTSLAANKVQELRGGLTEMTLALPHCETVVSTECVAAEPQERDSENRRNQRLQTIREWRDNFENGALYSGLQDYLSESQQHEIYDSVRMTLTARQLQFNPKNVEFVFDALWKAGGRLATLIEIAERNKAERTAGASEKSMPKIEPLPKLVGSDNQTLEISAPKTRVIFSNPSVCDDETAARFEKMFPSESTLTKPTALEHEIKPEQNPVEAPAESDNVTGGSVVVSAAETSGGALSFEEDLHERVFRRTAVDGLRPPVRINQSGSRAGGFEEPTSPFRIFEISGFQAAAFVFLIATICLTAGTLGHSLLGRRVQDTQKSTGPVGATSSATSNRVGQTPSPVSGPPPSEKFETPPVNPPAPETQGLHAENAVTQPSVDGRSTDSSGRATLTGPSSAVASRPHIDSDDSSAANRLDNTSPGEGKTKENARDSESFAKAPSASSKSSATIQSNPAAHHDVTSEPDRSSALFARNASPSAGAELTHPPREVGPTGGALRHPVPRRATPAMSAVPHRSRPSVLLVTAPSQSSKPFKVTFPQKAIAASSTFAIASQLSVVIPPEPGAASARRPARLQAGDLISYVWPRYPTPGDRDISTETVKVRVTIGKLGQIMDIKLLSGSTSLLPAAKGAIRQWRYKPTLLNQRPVRAQQDVTIEFRPPQHLSHVGAQRISHN